jgi:hypothetical protein
VIDPFSSLQRSVFMSGRGYSYFARTPGLPLSLKCMSNGRAPLQNRIPLIAHAEKGGPAAIAVRDFLRPLVR